MPAAPDLGRHFLLPHPVSEQDAVRQLVHELSVAVGRARNGQLTLSYRLLGELPALQLPEPRPPLRTDGLWRHSCFEAFIARSGAGEYWEYNFSPSGAWAAYHFNTYREGMAPLMRGTAPEIRQVAGEDAFELQVALDLDWLTSPAAGVGLRLGLSAVVEDKARVLSYWALKHPAEKPDFHHADGFVIELD
jgi:hypothetical protein